MDDPLKRSNHPRRRVEVLADGATLARRAANLVCAMLREAVAERGVARLALAGGSTPRATYEELTSRDLQWAAVDFVWGDERMVAPDHPASNVGMAHAALLEPLGIADARIHAPDTTLAPAQAALDYERRLRALDPACDPPQLDVVVLGIGTDGHTASLFPGGAELDAPASRLVVASTAPFDPPSRVSMTLSLLDAARNVVFLVSGKDKAAALGRVLAGDRALPAARVEPGDGQLVWLVDEAAFAEGSAD